MTATKITLTKNRQYGGSGEMPRRSPSAIQCLSLQLPQRLNLQKQPRVSRATVQDVIPTLIGVT